MPNILVLSLPRPVSANIIENSEKKTIDTKDAESLSKEYFKSKRNYLRSEE